MFSAQTPPHGGSSFESNTFFLDTLPEITVYM